MAFKPLDVWFTKGFTALASSCIPFSTCYLSDSLEFFLYKTTQIITNISTARVTPMIIPVIAPESESSLPEVPDILLPILFPVRVLLDPVLAEALIVLAPLAPLDELEPLLLLPVLPLLPDPDLELDI